MAAIPAYLKVLVSSEPTSLAWMPREALIVPYAQIRALDDWHKTTMNTMQV